MPRQRTNERNAGELIYVGSRRNEQYQKKGAGQGRFSKQATKHFNEIKMSQATGCSFLIGLRVV